MNEKFELAKQARFATVAILAGFLTFFPSSSSRADTPIPVSVISQVTADPHRHVFEFEVNQGQQSQVSVPIVSASAQSLNYVIYDATGAQLASVDWTVHSQSGALTGLGASFVSPTSRILFAVEVGDPHGLGTSCLGASSYRAIVKPAWWRSEWATPLVAVHSFGNNGSLKSLCNAFSETESLIQLPQSVPSTLESLQFTFAESSFSAPVSWSAPALVTAEGMFLLAPNFNASVTLQTTNNLQNLENMFGGASQMNSGVSISDTSSVSNFSGMFAAPRFNQPVQLDIRSSGPFGLSYMFSGATEFNSTVTFSGSESVTDFSYLFAQATSFNQPITFDTTNATTFEGMFEDASSFNQPLSLTTSGVTTFEKMFLNATSFDSDVSSFDTSNVVTLESMFEGAISFNRSINAWSLSSATNLENMFSGAQSFNQPVNLNLPAAVSIKYMFYGATALNSPVHLTTSPNLTGLLGLFSGASSFNSDLIITDTKQVRSFEEVFAEATAFNQPVRFDTDSATSFQDMFSGATSFNSPVSLSPTASLSMITRMFSGATSFNQILDFDTSNVEEMNFVFRDATSYNQPLTLVTTSVSDFSGMFEGATSFNQPISFDFSSAIYAGSMFKNATAFNQPLLMSQASIYNFNFILDGARRFDSRFEVGLRATVLDASSAFSGSGLSCERYGDFLEYLVATNQAPSSPTYLGVGFYPATAGPVRSSLNQMGWSLIDLPCPETPVLQPQLISTPLGVSISYSPQAVENPTWFEINPALPEGLSFSNLTGEIIGQTSGPGKTTHLLTVFNPAGSSSVTISIHIEPLSTPQPQPEAATPTPKLPFFELQRITQKRGEEVRVFGENLEFVVSAFIAGRELTLSSISPLSFAFTLPDIGPGLYDLVLQTTNGKVSYQGFIEIVAEKAVGESPLAVLIRDVNPKSSWLRAEQLQEARSLSSRFESIVCIAYNDKPGLIARRKALSRALQACRYAAELGIETQVFVYGKAPSMADTVKILSR